MVGFGPDEKRKLYKVRVVAEVVIEIRSNNETEAEIKALDLTEGALYDHVSPEVEILSTEILVEPRIPTSGDS